MPLTKSDLDRLPRFADLPVHPDAPPESAWGVFGDDDRLGCLNFLTPEGIVEAAGLVRRGKVFRLDAAMDAVDPPLFGRVAPVHRVVALGPLAHDDIIDSFNTQSGSQWDGLGHVGHVTHGAFYNGVTADEIRSGPGQPLGIQQWADKFVGRGVLVDPYAWRKAEGRPVEPLTSDAYTLDELVQTLAWQGTTLTPGSILLVRTGWMETYARCTAEERQAMAPFGKLHAIGLQASREVVAWLWDHRVAAIGTDCPAVESVPIEFGSDNALHFRTLSLLGLPLGELFVLAPLAEDCAADRRYEFLLVSAPITMPGGIATPPNAVAIK